MPEYDPNIDYLQEDEIINGQQYCCLSFVEPAEETEKHLEIYIFNQFLKHISKSFILTPRKTEEGGIELEQEHVESLNQQEEIKEEITIEEIKEPVVDTSLSNDSEKNDR